MNTAPLNGFTVLVTRPIDLAKPLARKIDQLGARPIIYPAIEINPPADEAQRDSLLQKLGDFDIAIFISPTAVTKTFEVIKHLPKSLKLAAIGSSTQQALQHNQQVVDILPEGYDSESLLQHHDLQADNIKGAGIIIFRGAGGRAILGDTLEQRGAKVSYAEMYQRNRPVNAASLSDDQLNGIDIISVTSNEVLQNLFDMTSNTRLLTRTPLLVPGRRTLELAEQLGFSDIHLAENATDAACIEALNKWAIKQVTNTINSAG